MAENPDCLKGVNSLKVISVNISEEKGRIKHPIGKAYLKENYGIEGDAHAGAWNRQISLLAEESIQKMKKLSSSYDFKAGTFAENITTEGIELYTLSVGTRLKLGDEVMLEITQIGKECHKGCEIRNITGMCIMPTEGVFAKVITAGLLKAGDRIEVLS